MPEAILALLAIPEELGFQKKYFCGNVKGDCVFQHVVLKFAGCSQRTEIQHYNLKNSLLYASPSGRQLQDPDPALRLSALRPGVRGPRG